jgi:hypothetical protein
LLGAQLRPSIFATQFPYANLDACRKGRVCCGSPGAGLFGSGRIAMFESLLEKIRGAGDDVAALMALKGEVDDLTGPEARDLKLRFGTVLFKARKSSGEISIKSILSRNGFERPDGRPLYKYTLSEAEFNGLRELLRTRCRNGFADCAWDVPALFVLWGAH